MKIKPLATITTNYKRTKRGVKYGNGKLGGYPGLASTAKQIIDYIPPCYKFVEPFAGLGRISKLVKADWKFLNDKNPYCVKYLQSKFPTYTITNNDFIDCIKEHDGSNTVLFLDPPWRAKIYENGYIDRKPREYYQIIKDMIPTLQSHWFLCCDVGKKEIGTILNDLHCFIKTFTSRRLIMGKPAKVMIYSNRPFINYNHKTLDQFQHLKENVKAKHE